MELWHTFTIECAHSLHGIGHAKLHGHSYWVTVYYSTSSDSPTPLAMIEGYCAMLRGKLDHQNLDDVMTQPTMESIAEFVCREIQGPRPTRVVVSRPSIGAGVEYVP